MILNNYDFNNAPFINFILELEATEMVLPVLSKIWSTTFFKTSMGSSDIAWTLVIHPFMVVLKYDSSTLIKMSISTVIKC